MAMALALLKSRTFWLVIAGLFVAGYLIHLGDRYGKNARLVAAYESEIRAKNTKIAEMQADDAQRALREQIEAAADKRRFDAANKMQCPADQATADAINALIGD